MSPFGLEDAMTTHRKIITRVVVLLLLGAIVNVAVAWGLCRTPNWSQPHTKVSPQEGAQRWWHANALETFPRDRELMEVMQWQRFANRYWNMSTFTHGADRYESGWPLYALERSYWVRILEIYQHQHALPLAPWLANWFGTQYLPMRPIWPGFAINTIFYAAALWLVFGAGPGFVRRRVRRGRGQCLHCGYDLRGQGPGAGAKAGASRKCPECGRSA